MDILLCGFLKMGIRGVACSTVFCQILSTVWGYDYIGDTNVVDVYIRYLRAKIDERFGEKYIHTMRGVGYVIKD